MELYTSLLRLKQALNGGVLPPMTELPASVLDVLDPTFTIGLGALTEDAELGLRCPVRGCGVWRHQLSSHVARSHEDMGGTSALKRLLELPQSVKLCSSTYRAAKVAEASARRGVLLASLAKARAVRPDALSGKATRAKANQSLRTIYQMAGTRNLANRCEAQMRHALIDLQNKLGRSPARSEADAMLGSGFSGQVIEIYGSWNAAKARFGLDQYRKGHNLTEISRESVLEALQAYYEKNGCLPNVNQAQKPTRTPLIPSRPTILKSMGTTEWPEAMRRVAALLDIRGGRYGLPERVKEVA